MLLNKQIPLKQEVTRGMTLRVNSIFYTIQGEGPFVGHPSVFVRLQGCNLQCPLCDTEYSTGKVLTVKDICDEVSQVIACDTADYIPLVVITGGEPFRQTIGPLIEELFNFGYPVQIETNGTLFDPTVPYCNDSLTIVCSPKAGKVNHNLQPYIDVYKYVLHKDSINPDDGLPLLALDHSAKPMLARPHNGFEGPIYIQPVDTQDVIENQLHLRAAVKSAMAHGYVMCIQTHKLMGVA